MLDPSTSLLELGFDENKRIRVHGGFKGEFKMVPCILFQAVEKVTSFIPPPMYLYFVCVIYCSEYLMGSHPSHDCKYKDIKGELIELYTSGECDGYDLIVTGHRYDL